MSRVRIPSPALFSRFDVPVLEVPAKISGLNLPSFVLIFMGSRSVSADSIGYNVDPRADQD